MATMMLNKYHISDHHQRFSFYKMACILDCWGAFLVQYPGGSSLLSVPRTTQLAANYISFHFDLLKKEITFIILLINSQLYACSDFSCVCVRVCVEPQFQSDLPYGYILITHKQTACTLFGHFSILSFFCIVIYIQTTGSVHCCCSGGCRLIISGPCQQLN